MRLTEPEYYKYLLIHLRLMYYVGIKLEAIPKNTDFEAFTNFTQQDKFPIRNLLYKNIKVWDDYISENPDKLSKEDKEIIEGFKNYKEGTFYVVRKTKKYTLFMDDKYVYGVYALGDLFETLLGNNFPIMIDTVLLPYNGKIVYDGMMAGYPIHFGGGIRSSIKGDFELFKGKYGIIEKLPVQINEADLGGVEKELIIMMKTQTSRDHHWHKIEMLLKENPDLMPVYIREIGRINSRDKRKELRELGLKKIHFAMYKDTIIASAKNKKEIEAEVKKLIEDKEKRESIYYFKL